MDYGVFNLRTGGCARKWTGTIRKSLHWKLTLGEKSLSAPGNRTCVGSVPVRCFTNWATSLHKYSSSDLNVVWFFLTALGNNEKEQAFIVSLAPHFPHDSRSLLPKRHCTIRQGGSYNCSTKNKRDSAWTPLVVKVNWISYFNIAVILCDLTSHSRSGKLRTQKLKSHLMRAQSLKVLPLKPGVGQYIAMHATHTAGNFFLANFYLPVNSPAFFSLKNLSRVFPVLAVANTSSCVSPQNKIGHPAECRFLRWVLAEYKQAPKHVTVFLVLRSEIVERIWAVV